jgi:UDP-glucose 4-epimerase
VHGDSKLFRFVSDEAYAYDVQRRIPDVQKAKDMLGFECKTTLSQMLDEVIPWIREEIRHGRV